MTHACSAAVPPASPRTAHAAVAPAAPSLAALWARLPAEVQEQVLASWEGQDALQASTAASQVHPSWQARLRWAQPRAYADLQQRLWLMEATAPSGVPTTQRSQEVLAPVARLDFAGVGHRDALERRLFEADGSKLAALAALMPAVTGCSLRGLKDGPALFARWARRSAMFAAVDHIALERSHVTAQGLRLLLQGAPHTPCVRRIEVGRAPSNRPIETSILDALHPKAAFNFAAWPLLEVLDLSCARMHLGKVQLGGNSRLRRLSIEGNCGADMLLFGSSGPQVSLRSLTVSMELWQMPGLGRFKDVAWAATLEHLAITRASSTLVDVHLGACAHLKHLNLFEQPVDFASLVLPEDVLQSLNLCHTTASPHNAWAPPPAVLSQLRRLIVGGNALHGLLNTLNLSAAPLLEVLDLSRATLTDADIETWEVHNLGGLKHLELSHNFFSGQVWAALAHKPWPKLDYLGLMLSGMRKDNTLVSAVVLAGPVRALFPKLTRLAMQTHGIHGWHTQEAFEQLLHADGIALVKAEVKPELCQKELALGCSLVATK